MKNISRHFYLEPKRCELKCELYCEHSGEEHVHVVQEIRVLTRLTVELWTIQIQCHYLEYCDTINLRKRGKYSGIIVCMGKIAASVLLKLFINGNERCYTTDAPFFKCKQHTIHDPRGPEKFKYCKCLYKCRLKIQFRSFSILFCRNLIRTRFWQITFFPYFMWEIAAIFRHQYISLVLSSCLQPLPS